MQMITHCYSTSTTIPFHNSRPQEPSRHHEPRARGRPKSLYALPQHEPHFWYLQQASSFGRSRCVNLMMLMMMLILSKKTTTMTVFFGEKVVDQSWDVCNLGEKQCLSVDMFDAVAMNNPNAGSLFRCTKYKNLFQKLYRVIH